MILLEKDIKNNTNQIIFEKDLVEIIKSNNPEYKDSSVRWTIYKLINSGVITKIGVNSYYKGKLKIYNKKLSSKLATAIKLILEKLHTDISFVVYESIILNEWVNHQISRNVIFIEVEKFFMKDIFRIIQRKYSNTLYNPSKEAFYLYEGDLIVVNQLVTQSPINKKSRTIKIEKLIVDLYTNDLINEFITENEKIDVITEMYREYKVNEKTIFAYAKRRNNYEILKDIINTIKIAGE